MRLSNTLKKETLIVAGGTLLCGLVLQGVFYLLSCWDRTVLFGNLYAWILSCLNFLWMGLSVRRASAIEEPKQASRSIKRNQYFRWTVVFLLVVCGAFLRRYFHIVALLVPLLFPQIVLIGRGLILKKPNDDSATDMEDSKNP
jgi:uncharacterized membrane protein